MLGALFRTMPHQLQQANCWPQPTLHIRSDIMFFLATYLKGIGLCASLIMAIGAQNAHVLRMGLRRQHILLTIFTCVAIDALLIALGVAGVGTLVQSSPALLIAARWGGAAFLLWYGLRSWRAVLSSETLAVGQAAPMPSAKQAFLTVLALSLLNPHVYLDTVVLIGAIGGQYPLAERGSFAGGAMTASLLWFSLLGLGAQRLSGLFARPIAWKCIDALTGTTMLGMAGMVAFAS